MICRLQRLSFQPVKDGYKRQKIQYESRYLGYRKPAGGELWIIPAIVEKEKLFSSSGVEALLVAVSFWLQWLRIFKVQRKA